MNQMKFHLLVIALLILSTSSPGQGILISENAYIKCTGSPQLVLTDAGITNSGSVAPATETWLFQGSTSNSLNGTAITLLGHLKINNSGGITQYIGELHSQSLTVESGSVYQIEPGKNLTTTGSTSLSSGQCLVLKSDASGTASFIDNGEITGSGTARIERYLTKYNVVSDLKFHFIASPVADGQSIENEFINLSSADITDFYKWDEPSNLWINYRGSTYNSRNEAFGDNFKFVAGKGYMVAYPGNTTKSFSGVPYTNSLGLTINCTNTDNRGWNLVGNPFPSALDWEAVLRGNGIDRALYYYDNETPGYKYYISYSGGLGSASQYIAPMQGFMVHANSSGVDKTITINNADRTHEGQNTFFKDQLGLSNILDLKVEGNQQSDLCRICFHDPATFDFDSEFDAFKLFSYNQQAPQIYTLSSSSQPLAINTLPEEAITNDVTLLFKPGANGWYNLTALTVSTFASSNTLMLEDKMESVFHPLHQNPLYGFSASVNDAPDRFILHFGAVGMVNQPQAANRVTAWYYNGQLCYSSPTPNLLSLEVFDLCGKRVARIDNPDKQPITIQHLKPGLYIVSIVASEGRFSTTVNIQI